MRDIKTEILLTKVAHKVREAVMTAQTEMPKAETVTVGLAMLFYQLVGAAQEVVNDKILMIGALEVAKTSLAVPGYNKLLTADRPEAAERRLLASKGLANEVQRMISDNSLESRRRVVDALQTWGKAYRG